MQTLRWILAVAGLGVMITFGYAMNHGWNKSPAPQPDVGPWTQYKEPVETVNKAEWIAEANKRIEAENASKKQVEAIADAVVDEQEARKAEKPRQ